MEGIASLHSCSGVPISRVQQPQTVQPVGLGIPPYHGVAQSLRPGMRERVCACMSTLQIKLRRYAANPFACPMAMPLGIQKLS